MAVGIARMRSCSRLAILLLTALVVCGCNEAVGTAAYIGNAVRGDPPVPPLCEFVLAPEAAWGVSKMPSEGGGWFTILLALALLVGNVYRFRVSRRLEIGPLVVSAVLFLWVFVSWASWYK